MSKQSNCPICGTVGKQAKSGDVYCPVHGWMEPVNMFDLIRRDFVAAFKKYQNII
jgi:uncharacterized Zn finger protein (UPF0148 family)